MNLVGKIFVVMIMLMSVVFSAFAVMVYSTHKNWRDEVLRTTADLRPGQTVGYIQQLENEKQRYDALVAEKELVEHELAALHTAKVQQLAKLEAERLRLIQERDTVQTSYTTLVATREEAIESSRLAQANLSRLGTEVDALRNAIREQQGIINDQFELIAQRTEQNHGLIGQSRLLKDRADELTQDLLRARELVGPDGSPRPTGAAPRITGRILAVNQERGYVEISVGSDDGIQERHELEVVRGGTYVGQVQVVRTTPNRAVARISRVERPINLGDTVTSRAALNLAGGR